MSGARHESGGPRRFEEVLGQTNAVDGLRRRAQARDQSGGVILYGPAGVGKRTLARLSAKAFLCEKIDETGSPCNSCSACQSFDEGSSLGYAEFDAKDGNPGERARRLVAEASYGSLVGRDVIVIRNADLYQPQDADVYLKTLEETRTLTTFLLLASDLKQMRLAVRSRCAIYRLRPLGTDETKLLCKRLSEAQGARFADSVLDLLAVASRGLPGELSRLISELAGDDRVTPEKARRKLGFDWAEDMIAYWSAILAGNETSAELDRLVSGPDPEESMRRLRLLFHHFYARELCQPPVEAVTDPALLQIDEKAWKELARRFNERARASQVAPHELWRTLAASSLSGDHFDAASALADGLGLRGKLKPISAY